MLHPPVGRQVKKKRKPVSDPVVPEPIPFSEALKRLLATPPKPKKNR
jgi:hypothetical protein